MTRSVQNMKRILLTLALVGCGSSAGGSSTVLPSGQTTGGGTGFGTGESPPPETTPPDNPFGPPAQLECEQSGASEVCFDGDATQVDVGECKTGIRTCTDGYWTPCIGQVAPVPEYCDYRDNDCDGIADEGVLSACGDCNPYCAGAESGVGTDDPLSPGEENSLNIVQTPDGWITLTETAVNLNVIWIANSQEGTVSKLDTTTGRETGRYRFCDDPSRTGVGKFGDGWIACRSNGSKVAYIYNFEGECVDKNGNGTIDTSRDLNNDGVISSNEMYGNGEDECIRWMNTPSGQNGAGSSTAARGVGVDLEENAWIGLWDSSQLVKLSQEEGTVQQVINIPAQPYGLVLDQAGDIWVSGRGGGWLVRAEPDTGQVSQFRPNSSYSPYGITVDEFGRIWSAQLGGDTSVYVFDPKTGAWGSIPVPSRGRGLVANGSGRIFVACDESHKIAVIDITTLTKFNEISLGGGHYPIGMAVDSAGFIWAVNQQSGTVNKLNGNSLAMVGEYPVGTGPYTYSDMTGSAFFDAVPPGWYRHRFEASHVGGVTGLAAMNNALWGTLNIEYVAPPGAYIKFRVRTAATAEEMDAAPWTPLVGPFPDQTFPVDLSTVIDQSGHYLDVEVWMYAGSEGEKPLLKGLDVQYEAAP